MADSMPGTWTVVGNSCVGANSSTTFNSQSTYIPPVVGRQQYIFMADRWMKTNLPGIHYIWLSIRFEEDKMVIEWKEQLDGENILEMSKFALWGRKNWL